ncbi:MAG: AtpZ/AtpI family protein [Ignavibacteriae bacterium]|nr:AtpZ/AtpI family protein [Ignavibacteriota bacterium]MCB9216111.1 AtpZ/AtpI family protein [Ignavibacteria bacterium]
MKPKDLNKDAQEMGSLLGGGIQLTVTILAFAALGWWLDTKFETQPWLLLAGLIFGATGGMISFIRTALSVGSSKRRGKEKQDSDRTGDSAKPSDD